MRRIVLFTGIVSIALGGPAIAQRGRWGGDYWGPLSPPPGVYLPSSADADPREGKVQAVHYLANSVAVAELGHGPVKVASGPGSMSVGLEEAAFESALVDQLVKAGYQTNAAPDAKGQTVEYTIRHDEVQPPEPPHSPVSGEVSVMGGNRGSAVGMAVAVDLSKPAKALIETRLDARIRDAATHELLWEGHAEIVTRDGDSHWSNDAIASRLAAELFRGFPHAG